MALAGSAPGPTGRCTTAKGSRHSHPCQLTFLGLRSLQARGECDISCLHSLLSLRQREGCRNSISQVILHACD